MSDEPDPGLEAQRQRRGEPVPAPCPDCGGRGYFVAPDNDWDEAECRQCKGTGGVPAPEKGA